MKLAAKLSALILLALFGGSFFSCSSQIAGTLKEGGAADFMVSTRLQPRMSSLIRSFQLMAGSGGGELILDGAAISRSMAAAPGMGAVSLANTGPAELEGMVELSRVGDFLAIAGREDRFVTYTENTTSGQGRITISLNRGNAPDVIALLSADAAAYLSALMAPAATGEVLSSREYLVLVGSLYGPAIADEIGAAKINAAIDFPGRVTAVRGGTAADRRAEFEVPLLDLLVLESPLIWEISWER